METAEQKRERVIQLAKDIAIARERVAATLMEMESLQSQIEEWELELDRTLADVPNPIYIGLHTRPVFNGGHPPDNHQTNPSETFTVESDTKRRMCKVHPDRPAVSSSRCSECNKKYQNDHYHTTKGSKPQATRKAGRPKRVDKAVLPPPQIPEPEDPKTKTTGGTVTFPAMPRPVSIEAVISDGHTVDLHKSGQTPSQESSANEETMRRIAAAGLKKKPDVITGDSIPVARKSRRRQDEDFDDKIEYSKPITCSKCHETNVRYSRDAGYDINTDFWTCEANNCQVKISHIVLKVDKDYQPDAA